MILYKDYAGNLLHIRNWDFNIFKKVYDKAEYWDRFYIDLMDWLKPYKMEFEIVEIVELVEIPKRELDVDDAYLEHLKDMQEYW